MVFFLGVCRALKVMHQYKVKGPPGGAKSQGKARRVREEAERADRDAAEELGHGDEEAEQPLMDGEITRSQDGVDPGQERAYAHRDIKPGTFLSYRWS